MSAVRLHASCSRTIPMISSSRNRDCPSLPRCRTLRILGKVFGAQVTRSKRLCQTDVGCGTFMTITGCVLLMSNPICIHNRRLKSVGLLSYSKCNGRLVTEQYQKLFYSILRRSGFVETRWQLIFDGQIGGLVLPYRDGKYEIHVRFYEDRIFAELEVGRSHAFHFLAPRMNANSYIRSVAAMHLADDTLSHLEALMHPRTQRVEEVNLRTWNHLQDVEPAILSCRMQTPLIELINKSGFADLLNWRHFYRLAGLSTSILVTFLLGLPVALVLVPLIFVTAYALPDLGRP